MRILALPLFLLACLIPKVVFALGLGEISVDSFLNQPLKAEITLLSVTQDELEDLQITLAPEEVFQRVGIDRPYFLTELKFEPVLKPDGQAMINLSTRDPVREPFLTFLVEIKWPKGRLLREYTVLLDPPVFLDTKTSPRTSPPEVETRSAGSIKSQSSASRPVRSPPVIVNSAEGSKSLTAKPQAGISYKASGSFSPDSYATQRGDTLWTVADAIRPSRDITVTAMMLALQRANPDAFIQGNINNLKAGEILRIPDSNEISQGSSQEMQAEVSRQNTLWKESQQSHLATNRNPNVDARQLDESAKQAAPEEPPATGTNTAEGSKKADDAAPSLEILASDTDKGDLPQTLAAGEGEESTEGLRKQLALSQETSESRARENDELVKRMQRLEALLDKQERILNLQSEQLAEIQQGFAAAGVKSAASTEKNLPVDQANDNDTETSAGEAEIQPTVTLEDDANADVDELDNPAERQATQDYYASLNQSATNTVDNQEFDSAAKQSVTPSAAVPAATVEESNSGWLESFKSQLANSNLFAILGALVLLVISFIWIVFRRISANRDVSNDESQNSFVEAKATDNMLEDIIATQANRNRAVIAEETHQDEHAVDSLSEPEVDSFLSSPDASAMDDTFNDDVLDDADVYIGYALYQQAEDLLKTAINKNPDKSAYRVKLAENYYASQDTKAFERVAEELRHSNLPESDWQHVLFMGKQMSSDSPLFAGTDSAEVSTLNDISSDGDTTSIQEEYAPTRILAAGAELDTKGRSVSDLLLNEESAEHASKDQEEAMSPNNTIAFDMSKPDVTDAHLDHDIIPTVISAADNSNILEFDIEDLDKLGIGLGPTQDNEDDFLASGIDMEKPGLTVVEEDARMSGSDSDDDLLATMIDDEMAAFNSEFSLDTPLDDDDLTTLFNEGEQSDGLSMAEKELEDTLLYDGESFSSDVTETFVMGNKTTTYFDESDQDLHQGGFGMIPGIDEVDTKLDLAKAYIDMGDSDGARSTLVEVLEEGDALQRQQAEELMTQCD